MGREVTIAQLEPCLLAVAAQHLQRRLRIPRHTPPGLGIGDAGQCVEHCVGVRHDVQAIHVEVVAGVDDDRKGVGRQRGVEAVGELGAANTAGQRGDHASSSPYSIACAIGTWMLTRRSRLNWSRTCCSAFSAP